MILTCPACETRFAVDAAVLGKAGRKVRCAKCGDSWHQMPEQDPPEIPMTPAAPKPETPVPVDEGDDETDAATEIDSEDDAADDDAADDDEDAAEPENKKDRRAKDRAKRAAGRKAKDGNADGQDGVGDGVWGGRKGGLIGWLVLCLVLAGIGGGGFFYQDKIVEIWPPAGQLYDLIGNATGPAKFGLAIQNVKWEHKREKGKPVLVVRGDVINISDEPQSVPRLRVIIRDENGRRLFRWTVTTALNNLEAGQGTAFTTRLANPPDGARSLAVTFLVQP
ncbi:MAG: DUF3426 domain-containing protein [Rhodospirillaceae bacterium]|jgi:predicted Zn finger-like uncharacterized protein|nr:DUF3426 domain-containing protein [Rhodospirillaceae bacterium]MBT4046676.1 DUF3426 domain-containing protein [Rhodospirillaceae bacterium]MBT4691250.1 DUF3426 domain-containing protein [Rhodospirillaceae bacterium]MBT5082537.1 DUF3426 domain-containing protein [Rhodospirillaceae bacterium]MBT5525412.1 DUF3426 domain-containing protein [Rhodospirillaceae bacterium]